MATAAGASVTRTQVLSLYKLMLKEARQFVSFNYRYKLNEYRHKLFCPRVCTRAALFICILRRSFAIRRIRDGFRANKCLGDAGDIKMAYDKAVNSYEILQRQVSSIIYCATC